MKKLSFLALAAVGLLFGACASDNDVAEKTGEIAEHGQGYFKVGINLPSIPSTRADWNEEGTGTKLHDGKESEWTVENTVLLIFSGSSEATATLAQVNTIAGDYTKDDTDDPNQVTSRKEYVIELTASRTSNLYALAVVNGAGVIEQGAGNSVKINGGSDVSGITLGDLQSALATAAPTGMSDLAGKFVNSSKHIFMTNAVLSDVQGGKVIPTGAKPFTLAPIDKTKVYVDHAGALAGTAAADIYVERAVAKVTIDGTTSLTVNGIATAGTTGTPTATFAGWCLDNTNKSSYVVRNVPAAQDWTLVNAAIAASTSTDKYRFVGQSSVDGAGAVGFRTYWAQDPNYDIAYAAANFYSPTTKSFVAAVGNDNPLYCFENTFTVANQSVKNTTRAIVKVTLNGGADFFTLDGDRKTIYPVSELKKLAVSNLFTDGDFVTWYGTNGKPEADANNLKKVYGDIVVTFDYGTKASGSAGRITVKQITIPGKALTSGSDVTISDGTPAALTDIITRINSKLKTIRYYKDGETYYTIRIQHFGNDLTPWNTTEYSGTAPAENTIASIYPGTAAVQDKNYLGRYGMVRNNWYELTLGEVLKIGSAVVPGIDAKGDPDEPSDPDNPDDPDHPDDSIDELYIKARINVLSWAKRPQSWDLK